MTIPITVPVGIHLRRYPRGSLLDLHTLLTLKAESDILWLIETETPISKLEKGQHSVWQYTIPVDNNFEGERPQHLPLFQLQESLVKLQVMYYQPDPRVQEMVNAVHWDWREGGGWLDVNLAQQIYQALAPFLIWKQPLAAEKFEETAALLTVQGKFMDQVGPDTILDPQELDRPPVTHTWTITAIDFKELSSPITIMTVSENALA